MLGQLTADGTGLLGTEISGNILSLGVLKAKGFTLLLRKDSQNASDGFADSTTIKYC